jgi:hypothetical protein
MRIATAFAIVGATLGAIGLGIWLLLSSLFAPSIPNMDSVAIQLERTGSAVLFLGAAAERMNVPAQATISNVRELFGPGFVRIASSVKKPKPKGRTGGARINLNPNIRSLLEDSTLRAVVVARATPGNPSPELALAISAGGSRTSHWQKFEIDQTFRPYSVEYTFDMLPRATYLSILADRKGEGRGVDVREVSLHIVPN